MNIKQNDSKLDFMHQNLNKHIEEYNKIQEDVSMDFETKKEMLMKVRNRVSAS